MTQPWCALLDCIIVFFICKVVIGILMLFCCLYCEFYLGKKDSQQTETTMTSNPTGLSKLQTLMTCWMSGIQHNMSQSEHVPRELNKKPASSPTETKKQLKKQEQKQQQEKEKEKKTVQQTEVSDERPKTFRKDFCDESQLECINCRGGEKRLTRCRGCW